MSILLAHILLMLWSLSLGFCLHVKRDGSCWCYKHEADFRWIRRWGNTFTLERISECRCLNFIAILATEFQMEDTTGSHTGWHCLAEIDIWMMFSQSFFSVFYPLNNKYEVSSEQCRAVALEDIPFKALPSDQIVEAAAPIPMHWIEAKR